uniref:glucose-6-phosphate dehydrogenase (NADP(+)) n=1 Tax=Odontella aurita TaxID=265563 RepID=A0A7S4K5Z5_9STRA
MTHPPPPLPTAASIAATPASSPTRRTLRIPPPPRKMNGDSSSGANVPFPNRRRRLCPYRTSPPPLNSYLQEGLSVVVVGASGDLAKKKTYPSLLALFASGLLPPGVSVWGYARSGKTDEEFRDGLRPYLLKSTGKSGRSSRGGGGSKLVDEFLLRCRYRRGKSYGDVPSYVSLVEEMRRREDERDGRAAGGGVKHNRLFYLAVPPDVFGDVAGAVRETAMERELVGGGGGEGSGSGDPADDASGHGGTQTKGGGWVRLVVEKPFGRDLPTCLSLSSVLSRHFSESHLYRIDHYLGKEMVQNLWTFRFGNDWAGHLWHGGAIRSVTVEWKEDFGTEGRGGYFDRYGIVRDVIQNHLLQVLTLLAMEPPALGASGGKDGEEEGHDAAERVRDAKVAVLKSIPPVTPSDVILGQYEGYADDPTIQDKETACPTYAAVRLHVNTPRWEGVPFLLVAGKALEERACRVRVRFRPPPGSFSSSSSPTVSFRCGQGRGEADGDVPPGGRRYCGQRR